MTTTALRSHAAARPLALTSVVLALLGVLLAVASFTGWDPSWMSYPRVLIHLGELAGVLALALLGVAGTGWAARIGTGAAALGCVLLALAEGLYPTLPGAAEPLFGVGPVLVGLGLVVAGLAVLRSGRARGAVRVIPLVLGAYVLVGLIPAIIVSGGPPAPGALSALMLYELGWAVLGLSVLARSPRP